MKKPAKTGDKDLPNPFPGTAIRVNEDGSQDRVPFIQLKIGDVVLDDRSGKKMCITTVRLLLGELATGRFQFTSGWDQNWYGAVTHGRETLYYWVDQPTSPFSEGRPKYLEIAWQNTPVNVLTFEEVAEELVPV